MHVHTQSRKVLRVVCRWDLGAPLVQELLDDMKVCVCVLWFGVGWGAEYEAGGFFWPMLQECARFTVLTI